MISTRPSLAVQPVILCGGSGTRLWPLSRAGFPKQFLCLTGQESLFQSATKRLAQMEAADISVSAPLISANEEHRFLVLDQLREIGSVPSAIFLEPAGRNTAPALTLAALAADTDPVLVVTPADQGITDPPALIAALRNAARQAAEGAIVILGIAPTRPETGYGYIHAGRTANDGGIPVRRFVEKPDFATAQDYLADGGYFWNSGMFVLKASVWLAALQRFRPDIATATQEAWNARSTDGNFVRPGRAEFEAIPADSVDYAVMERGPGQLDIRMVPLAAGWSDLGAWDAVWQIADKDLKGNVQVGDVMITDSSDSLVYATNRLVSLVGLSNVVVVETSDAVLVTSRQHAQDVKQIVARLNAEGRNEHVLHRKVHRPWGWYDGVDEGSRFKVRRVQVKPGASLTLQKHHHRAEHWIVVKGTAKVACGDKTVLLTENESTYIPPGETHRVSNPGSIPLEIIEVKSGSYLGEDDVVRFGDVFGRDLKS